MSRRAQAWFAVTLAAFIVMPTTAAASEVSSEELRVLAEQALLSQSNEAALRAVTVVDDVPVDIDGLIGDDSNTRERIATLAALPIHSSSADVAGARTAANDILTSGRYQSARPGENNPNWLESAIGWIIDHIPRPVKSLFGSREAWVLLGVIALVVMIASAARHGRKRLTEPEAAGHASSPTANAPDLMRAADEAERAGDYSQAVRLRFAATVVDLRRIGVVASEQTTTAGMVRRALPGQEVSTLSRAFEQVAYAAAPASADDAAAARVGWSRVLSKVTTSRG